MPNSDPHLTARRTGQELAESHDVKVMGLVEPLPPLYELGPEIAQMSDWPTERGQLATGKPTELPTLI